MTYVTYPHFAHIHTSVMCLVLGADPKFAKLGDHGERAVLAVNGGLGWSPQLEGVGIEDP